MSKSSSFSFSDWYAFPSDWVKRALIFVPVVVAVLFYIWMKLVSRAAADDSEEQPGKRAISLEEAYLDAALNDATEDEDDIPDEDEDDAAAAKKDR